MLLGLLILVLAALWGVWGGYEKREESAALRTQAEAQLKDLSERQAQLTSDIANLETDRGMEEVLREQYALAAKGERLIVIVDAPKPAPLQATSSILDRIKKAFWWW